MSRKAREERRDATLFVRLTERESRIIEAAVKLRYGKVDRFKSEFARQGVLWWAKKVIEEHKARA